MNNSFKLPISIHSTQHQGRFVVAERDITKGEQICSSPTLTAVVYGQHANKVCHTCFNDLPQNSFIRCEYCHFAHYCSKECQQADKVHSLLECPIITSWNGLKDDADTRCLLRLLTLIVEEQKIIVCF